MKVKCINIDYLGQRLPLIINKWYEVIEINNMYRIIFEEQPDIIYNAPKNCFITKKQYRKLKLEKINEYGKENIK